MFGLIKDIKQQDRFKSLFLVIVIVLAPKVTESTKSLLMGVNLTTFSSIRVYFNIEMAHQSSFAENKFGKVAPLISKVTKLSHFVTFGTLSK